MQNVIERILNLLAFLLTVERPVTADEVRNTVAGYDRDNDEAFHRMFERDKTLLRQLGVPLELRPTDAWAVDYGYVVPDSYALVDPHLSDDEKVALFLASNVVRIGGSAPGPDALFKLGGVRPSAAGEPLAADLGADADALGVVFQAVAERRQVQFSYRDRQRIIDAYGLVHRRGHWYLVGPEGEGDPKVFRLDRMMSVTADGEPGAFERPKGFRASDTIPSTPWEAGADDLMAEVVFDPEVAWWARRQVGSRASIVDGSDGGITVTMPVANPDAFIGWMLGFDDKAEIVAPAELRDRLVLRITS